MREIKIRVWLKDEKRFSYHNLSLHEYVGGLAFLLEEEMLHEINLFTGLKDKNGKEIYEGDIIEFDYKEISMIGDIRYILGSFKICNKLHYPIADNIDIYRNKIIGNIYENKDLIK